MGFKGRCSRGRKNKFEYILISETLGTVAKLQLPKAYYKSLLLTRADTSRITIRADRDREIESLIYNRNRIASKQKIKIKYKVTSLSYDPRRS